MALNLSNRIVVASIVAISALIYSINKYADTLNSSWFSNTYDSLSWRTYFGDSLPNISSEDLESFNRGFLSFVTPIEVSNDKAKNASSCLECHNTPMPGGSGGVSLVSKVGIDLSAPNGSRVEVLQSNHQLSLYSKGSSFRRTPALFGLGLVENANLDNERRFGILLKSSNLHEIVSEAFATELGVSTSLHCARKVSDKLYPEICSPDIDDQIILDVASYIRNLAPPRSVINHQGRHVFNEVGCSSCHTPTISTRHDAPPTFSNLTFHPFSDFQAHDLGSGKAIRTSPLWGLSSYGPPYMSDGQSFKIEDAIRKHGGEAEHVTRKYFSLPVDQRMTILQFLENL